MCSSLDIECSIVLQERLHPEAGHLATGLPGAHGELLLAVPAGPGDGPPHSPLPHLVQSPRPVLYKYKYRSN